MILGSHNSWSYLPAKKWWMTPFKFVAKCQNINIRDQYNIYNVRCFDLRIRFNDKNELTVAHGLMEYKISESQLLDDLQWLNNQKDTVYIRIIHEARNKKQYTEQSKENFIKFILAQNNKFSNLKFWCGRNLYNWEFDFYFGPEPTCEEKYSSVCPPKLLDDWYPRIYAELNNKKILKEGTDKEILLIDFVNYGH